MVGRAHGQGAALTVVPAPSIRSPEREALARAITERERVKGIVDAKRATIDGMFATRSPLYAEQEELERQLANQGGLNDDRLAYLLEGREPAPAVDTQAIQTRIADLDREIEASKAAERRAQDDLELLVGHLGNCTRAVTECVTDVVQSHPAFDAAVQELRALQARVGVLMAALDGPLNRYHPGQPMRTLNKGIVRTAVMPGEPTPWDHAVDRLHHDPDATVPMPADV